MNPDGIGVKQYQWAYEAKCTTNVNRHNSHTQKSGTVSLSELCVILCISVCECAKSRLIILGQNSPPGDSTQMFPAECGSDSVRGLIRKDRERFLLTHSLLDGGVILESRHRRPSRVLFSAILKMVYLSISAYWGA